MKVLIACEESQRVCKAFRERKRERDEIYSCDIIDCSGGHPEWHIKGDVTKLLNGNCKFTTRDGVKHKIDGEWDLIIAHPPCTYLTTAGNRTYSLNTTPAEKIVERYQKRDKAIEFFVTIANCNCKHIAIENPQGYMNKHYRKPDQTIHPYYFAESVNDTINYNLKRTCLWLKNLPLLERTNDLPKPEPKYISQNGKRVYWCDNVTKDRAKIRSKTFPAIANAMAEQWGEWVRQTL